MKSILAIVFCMLVFVACKKEVIVEPTPITYTIVATAGNGGSINPSGVVSVKAGETQIYTITVNDNYNLVAAKVDGVDQTVTDNKFSVTNVLSNKVVEVSFISKKMEMLTKATWKLKGIRVVQDGVIQGYYILDNEQLSDIYSLKKDGTYQVTHANGVQFADGKWSLLNNESRILIGSQNCQIMSLTDKEFIRSIAHTYNDKPCTLEHIWFRP